MQDHEIRATVNKVNNLHTYIYTKMQIYRFISSYNVIILSVQYQWHRKWLMDAFGFIKACGDPQGGNGRDIQSQWVSDHPHDPRHNLAICLSHWTIRLLIFCSCSQSTWCSSGSRPLSPVVPSSQLRPSKSFFSAPHPV